MPNHGERPPLLSAIRALGGVGARRFGAVTTNAVNCGSAANLDDIGGANATQSWLGWFRPSALGNNLGMFGKGFGFGGAGFGVAVDSTLGDFQITKDRATDLNRFTTGGGYLRVGQWSLIAVTLDLGATTPCRAYVGRTGRAAQEVTGYSGTDGAGANVSDAANAAVIGNITGPGFGTFPFLGDIGPVALFDRALSLDEIRAWQVAPWADIPNLKGLWLPGHKHGKVIDWSGNGNHGTPSGTQLVEGPPINVARRRSPLLAIAPATVRLGVFDPHLVAAAWFDETQVVEGWVTGELIDAPASGGAFSQALDGALTLAGTLVRQLVRGLAGASTPAGSLSKQAGRALAGATTPDGTIAKQPARALTGTTTPSGVLSGAKRALLSLTGATTPAGALTSLKLFVRAFTGDTTPGGALTKQPARALTGSVTPSGTATRQTVRPLTGSSAPTGALGKQSSRTLSGSTTPSGVLASLRTFLRTVAGAIAPSGTVARTGFGRTLAGSSTPSGTISRRTSRALAGTTAPAGAVARLTFRVVGGALVPTGLLAKRPARALTGGITLSGILARLFSALLPSVRPRAHDHSTALIIAVDWSGPLIQARDTSAPSITATLSHEDPSP